MTDRAKISPIAAGRDPLLAIRGLTTRFATGDGEVRAVNDISLDILPGETIGIVGESGSGKSQLMLSVMGLIAPNGRIAGSARFEGRELVGLPDAEMARIRGSKIAMIFQDPMTSLNPYLTIERQMTEVLMHHQGLTRQDAIKRSVAMLDIVRIPEAKRRLSLYPHEFSGGMRQRVMIAMALLCQPKLLIADEPTTALDVTVQAQILDLMKDLKREFNTAIALITHDLGVIAGIADRLVVMYAGRIVETGDVDDLFYRPRHPYTEGLLTSMPRLDGDVEVDLPSIGGAPPDLSHLPSGCSFRPRCRYAERRCGVQVPELAAADDPIARLPRAKACHVDLAMAEGATA